MEAFIIVIFFVVGFAIICCPCCFLVCRDFWERRNNLYILEGMRLPQGDLPTHVDRIVCHLCGKSVNQTEWVSGSHRRSCFALNRDAVRNMSTPYPTVSCPNCGKVLKMWFLCPSYKVFHA